MEMLGNLLFVKQAIVTTAHSYIPSAESRTLTSHHQEGYVLLVASKELRPGHPNNQILRWFMRIFPRGLLSILVFSASHLVSPAQTAKSSDTNKSGSAQSTDTKPTSAQSTDIDETKKITDGLAKQNNADFELQVGIGSLIRNGQITDYVNNANTLTATSLGGATPQYLVGVSMRSTVKDHIRKHQYNCYASDKPPADRASDKNSEPTKTSTETIKTTVANGKTTIERSKTSKTVTEEKAPDKKASPEGKPSAETTPAVEAKPSAGTVNLSGTVTPSGAVNLTGTVTPSETKPRKVKNVPPIPKDMDYADACPIWLTRPWSGFVSLKFASGTSSTLNGFVVGGAYGLMHYLNVMVGYALTPVNEPSHGLRNAAALYVTNQQKLGNYLSFNPVAMQNNDYNAFDGFSLIDSSGKLIYTGTPLEVHYRSGAIVGISIPLSFSGFLQGK
jgi:hypothetical protein